MHLGEEVAHPDGLPDGHAEDAAALVGVGQEIVGLDAARPAAHVGERLALLGAGLCIGAWTFAPNAGTDPWYVAQAHADGNGDGTYCVMVATSFTPDVRVVNEGD